MNVEMFRGSRIKVAGLLVIATGGAALAVLAGTSGPAEAAARRHTAHRGSTATTAPAAAAPTTVVTTKVESAPATPQTTTTVATSSTAGGGTASTSGGATTTTSVKRTATTPTTAAPSTATTAAPQSSPASSVLFGAVTDTLPQLSTFESKAGKKVSLFSYYASFANDADFDASAAAAVRSRGAIPMLTWEPWNPSAGSVNQPDYSLASLVGGAHDAYLARWANEIKAYGQPLWLRFAHEMNGDWYPWAEGVNGNTAGQYAAAFRHVHDVFANNGVTNVTWVWTPNVLIPGRASLASLYPGDGYVDWIGVDGYNWGSTASWSSWQSPSDVFGATLANLRQVSRRPIVIGETASTEIGGNKAQWIHDFFSMLTANPDIKAFVWFDLNKETDWRIESSSAAQAAFAAGVADSRYRAG